MNILQRLARLVRADIHATLDQWELPAAQLKQSLREMEAVLGTWEQQIVQGQQQQQRMERQLAVWQQSVAQVRQQVSLSLDQQRDELARPLLRRRLWLEQQITLLQQRRQQLDSELQQLRQELDQGRQQWQLLREQCASWVAQEEGADPAYISSEHVQGRQDWISDHAVEVALLQELQRRAQHTTELQAAQEGAP